MQTYGWLFIALLLGGCSKNLQENSLSGNSGLSPQSATLGALAAVSISNPGFENDKTDWGDPSLFAISTSDHHSGSKSAKLTASGNRITQTVTVAANTDYTLSAWILGKGTIGAKSGSTVLNSKGGTYSSWTKVSVPFNSGNATSIEIYGSYNAGEGRFDDFALDGGGTVPPTGLPADVLNLTNWKITLPIDENDDDKADEIKQPQLASYSNDPYFHNNSDNTGVIFRAHCGGATTSGSGYPRSELREMKDNGSNNASWSATSGTHVMEIDQAITHLPVVKPHIVVGQIHDASDDVIVFRLEGKKLFIDHNGSDGTVLTDNYTLGTRFKVKFEVSGGKVKSYYNNVLKETYTKSFSGAYFKAGAYTQSSCQGDKQVPGESCSAYGEAVIYNVTVTHQ